MIHSRQTLPNIASKRNMICSVPLCNVSRMDSNDLDSPGKRLKWAREKAGFQQAGDFAKRVGVHPTTYRAYENDQNGFAKKVHEFAERLGVTGARSEERTSELQSLMRISYAVFCLNKKTKHIQ